MLHYNLGNVLFTQKVYRPAMDAYMGYLKLAPEGTYAFSRSCQAAFSLDTEG